VEVRLDPRLPVALASAEPASRVKAGRIGGDPATPSWWHVGARIDLSSANGRGRTAWSIVERVLHPLALGLVELGKRRRGAGTPLVDALLGDGRAVRNRRPVAGEIGRPGHKREAGAEVGRESRTGGGVGGVVDVGRLEEAAAGGDALPGLGAGWPTSGAGDRHRRITARDRADEARRCRRHALDLGPAPAVAGTG
jgi:hypothetical protein